MKWMFWRRREPQQILELLVRQTDLTQRGLLLLEQYMREPLPAVSAELHHVEEEADEVRRVLIDELNRNFVTPFDREDVFALSRAIDDMVDYADTTVDEMVLLGMTGMHALHVVSGIVFILIVWNNGRRGLYSSEQHWGVEACAIWWHYVDLVWVFFYPALYLMGQAIR